MVMYQLVEITTKDKLVHQGIFYKPSRLGNRAILWVHGLTDNFYGDWETLEELARVCDKEGWGLASFNTRGHDIVTSISKIDPTSPKGRTGITAGSAYENFSECIYDLDAGISFLESKGFTEVVLVGISTGANKVCFYAGTKKDPRVRGVVLVSPISDPAVKIKEAGKSYEKIINEVKQLVTNGRGDTLLENYNWMPLAPTRFLSLYQEGGEEDTFPYYQKNPRPKVLSRITKPMMVVLGERDEWSDRPVSDVLKFFKKYQKSKNFYGVVIPQAFHSYGGKEKELAREVRAFMKTIS